VLAEAYMLLAKPDFNQALSHAMAVLSDETDLSPEQRVAALLLKAKILDRLNRVEEARQTLTALPAEAATQPAVLLARGQVLLDGVESALQRLPAQDSGKLPPDLTAQVDEAVAALREAQSSNHLAADVVGRSLFLMGRAAELRGDQPEALKLYTRTHQQFGESPEGLAAKLAVGDMARRAGDDKMALYWYHQVLQGDVDPVRYRSDALPINKLRERILDAVGSYVDKEAFANVVALLDQFTPLFSRTEELEIRSGMMRRWGDRQLEQAAGEGERGDEARHAGLRRLREAGMAYERLAALHFATQYYTSDIWNSADCFFRGQSYSNAARVLDIYLQAEPAKLNAQALLRLGQSGLALGRVDACIQSLEECIELYGNDNATYQARIDLAKAYGYKGNTKESEHQLRVNLTESPLKPQSPEWKDSLFALGTLMFEQNRNEEAIGTLEEAVERYPNDRQTIEARYMIGEAYRRWANEPLSRLQQARTNSEREKNQQLVNERLSKALENFKAVQSSITLKVRDAQEDPIYAALRRNCYMLEGAVLFDMGRYKDAIEAYQNVSSLYPNQPFVLETFVQIANCWQKLDRPENAEGAIKQAQSTLEQIPSNADFASTTAFSRDEWHLLLTNMRQW
jgi:TolA-binding protein